MNKKILKIIFICAGVIAAYLASPIIAGATILVIFVLILVGFMVIHGCAEEVVALQRNPDSHWQTITVVSDCEGALGDFTTDIFLHDTGTSLDRKNLELIASTYHLQHPLIKWKGKNELEIHWEKTPLPPPVQEKEYKGIIIHTFGPTSHDPAHR